MADKTYKLAGEGNMLLDGEIKEPGDGVKMDDKDAARLVESGRLVEPGAKRKATGNADKD